MLKLEKFSKARTKPVTTIVAHATAGNSFSGAVQALINRELSYHYIIRKSGVWEKLVPISRVAFHAGKSVGPNGKGVNEYSIGISLVGGVNGANDYTQEQFDSFVELCLVLRNTISSLDWLTTHYWVSPGRKIDPRGFKIEEAASKSHLLTWSP